MPTYLAYDESHALVEQSPPDHDEMARHGWRFLCESRILKPGTFDYVASDTGPDAGRDVHFVLTLSADGLNGGWWHTLYLMRAGGSTIIGSYNTREEAAWAAENWQMASKYLDCSVWDMRELTTVKLFGATGYRLSTTTLLKPG